MNKDLIKTIFWTSLGAVLIFAGGFDLYAIALLIHVARVAAVEVKSSGRYRDLGKFYRDFSGFLDSVRHYYCKTGSVAEAVWEAKEISSGVMKSEGTSLYGLLSGKADSGEREVFLSGHHDRFFKMFAAIALRTEEDGDDSRNGGFAGAVSIIKSDVNDELRYLEKKKHVFAGFSLTAALPVIFVPYICNWGVDTIEGMRGIYLSAGGRILKAVMLIVSALCYSAIVYLRDGEETEKKHRLLRRIAGRFGGSRLLRQVVKHSPTSVKSDILLRMFDAHEGLTAFYIRRIFTGLAAVAVSFTVAVYEALGGTGSIWWIVLAAVSGPVGYMYPYAELILKKSFIKSSMQEEVLRFQSIIAVEQRMPGASVLGMLEQLEQFADIYRPQISRCINDYMVDDEEALQKLRDSEYYIPFRQLADCFIMAAETGPEDAFAEVSSDMSALRESNRQDRQLLLEDKANLGMILAVLPGMLILLGYLLVPFMVNALTMFEQYAVRAENLLEE